MVSLWWVSVLPFNTYSMPAEPDCTIGLELKNHRSQTPEVLIIGERDRVAPNKFSRVLRRKCSEQKSALVGAGVGGRDCYLLCLGSGHGVLFRILQGPIASGQHQPVWTACSVPSASERSALRVWSLSSSDLCYSALLVAVTLHALLSWGQRLITNRLVYFPHSGSILVPCMLFFPSGLPLFSSFLESFSQIQWHRLANILKSKAKKSNPHGVPFLCVGHFTVLGVFINIVSVNLLPLTDSANFFDVLVFALTVSFPGNLFFLKWSRRSFPFLLTNV